jgi:DNA-directed RNA polymerase specialized sigma24 family protein
MSKRKVTAANLERIADMRHRGRSYGQISRALGVSQGAVSWHCLRLGIEPPKPRPLNLDYHLQRAVVIRGGRPVRAFTPEEDAKLIAFDLEGLRYVEIARRLGRRHNSVSARLATLARREERTAGGGP